jgi:phosphohistidine phosphatase SixA
VNVYLVRHAHAGDRSRWNGDDAERPLSARGRDQADAVAQALRGAPIVRVLSSPALRCRQTVGPLAHLLGLDVEIADELDEDAALRPARALLDATVRADRGDVVMCGHGDLLPQLLDDLRRDGVEVDGDGCAKGSVWQVTADGGQYVRAVYHRHPEDSLRTT